MSYQLTITHSIAKPSNFSREKNSSSITTFFSLYFRVAMRQQGDLIRSVYPKLILEGGNGFNEATGQMQPLSSAVLKKPPLARAVHLTLGVAVLGR